MLDPYQVPAISFHIHNTLIDKLHKKGRESSTEVLENVESLSFGTWQFRKSPMFSNVLLFEIMVMRDGVVMQSINQIVNECSLRLFVVGLQELHCVTSEDIA